MHLDFLDFEYTEDDDGNGSFDAMASALPHRLPALLAEVARVLDWAEAHFPGAQAPLESGGQWDFALQGTQELSTALVCQREPGTLRLAPRGEALARVTLTLTLTGTPAFCAELREAFEVA